MKRYLNIDAGTMSPFEHGECFVLDDGGECDLDLGNYERHLGVNLQSCHSITTGKIYQRVIERERTFFFIHGRNNFYIFRFSFSIGVSNFVFEKKYRQG